MSDTRVLNFKEDQSPLIEFDINGEVYTMEYGSTQVQDAIEKMGDIDAKSKTNGDLLGKYDRFLDIIFGKDSSKKMFTAFPHNAYHRVLVVRNVMDAYRNSDQAQEFDAVLAEFNSENIDDEDS